MLHLEAEVKCSLPGRGQSWSRCPRPQVQVRQDEVRERGGKCLGLWGLLNGYEAHVRPQRRLSNTALYLGWESGQLLKRLPLPKSPKMHASVLTYRTTSKTRPRAHDRARDTILDASLGMDSFLVPSTRQFHFEHLVHQAPHKTATGHSMKQSLRMCLMRCCEN